VRAFLLNRDGVSYAVSASVSMVQGMFSNTVLGLLCLAGAFHWIHDLKESGGEVPRMIEAGTLTLAGVVALMLLVFYSSRFRRWLFGVLAFVVRAYDRNHPGTTLPRRFSSLHRKAERSFRLMNRGGAPLFASFLALAVDWGATAAALAFCFRAVGADLNLGMVLVAFTVVFLTSEINIVPAGLGITEGLLVLVLSAVNVPPEHTLIAALLYRVVYFWIPLGVSFLLGFHDIRVVVADRAVRREAARGR
jgi:uncharacterized protein (TIRG00374 family)